MINANELRIGNLVYLTIDIFTDVQKIQSYDIITIEKNIINRDFTIHPIPITEDVLYKEFGFKKNTTVDENKQGEYKEMTWYSLDLSEDKYTDLSLISSYVENGDIEIELFPYDIFKYKYVHEIQNLYFSLTKTELNEL